MSVFKAISESEIGVGQPVTNGTQTKMKDNFYNLNERVTSLEGGGSTVYPPLVMRVNGCYGEPGDFDVTLHGVGVLKTTLNFNLVITGVRILIDQAGISGTTEIDLKFKRGAAAYTSVFTTKPSVVFSSGDDSISTNAVLDLSKVNLQAGDILRLDIISVQYGAKNFTVRIDYNKE